MCTFLTNVKKAGDARTRALTAQRLRSTRNGSARPPPPFLAEKPAAPRPWGGRQLVSSGSLADTKR